MEFHIRDVSKSYSEQDGGIALAQAFAARITMRMDRSHQVSITVS